MLLYFPCNTFSCPPLSPQRPHPAPAKLGFLVSFLVDARGGAMKGNRGSGMRLIIPPGKRTLDYFQIKIERKQTTDYVHHAFLQIKGLILGSDY